MTKTMKDKTGRQPLAAYFCTIGASLLLMLLFETGVLESGWLAAERQTEFVVATVMVLVTIGCAPLSLRFPHFSRVADAVKSGKCSLQGGVFTIRLMLLGIPMLANTLLYYAFMSPRFGYMAIILLLCMLCIYPSVNNDDDDNGGDDNGGDDNANNDEEDCQ